MRKLLFLLSLIILTSVSAQDVQQNDTIATDSIDRLAPDFVTASICTADPTDWHDDLLGVLGHAFIRLQCPTFGLDYCYSYEGESANDDINGLLTGNLKMGLFAAPTQEYIEPYKRWNRTIREYNLNLPPAAKLRLWEIMDKHLEEGTGLPLDLTAHGCVQTIVQNITQALDTVKIEYGEWPEEYGLTRYEMADEALASYPWIRLMAKCLGMYGNFDKDCSNEEKIIMPRQIVEMWTNAKINGEPMLTYIDNLTQGEAATIEKPWFTPTRAAIILCCLIFTTVLLIFRRRNK